MPLMDRRHVSQWWIVGLVRGDRVEVWSQSMSEPDRWQLPEERLHELGHG